ncbi:MAG TPA: molybdenum cofactor guanylyltransferase [Terriglobales bacterium]|nr:molybdenum cofactor guanylyltransferase [Terriglobales bacterium]
MPRSDLTGFILAGGRSRRMGEDKAQLSWQGGTFLTHAIAVMRQVSSQVCVVGGTETGRLGALQDNHPGRGPLGGIQTALHHTQTDWNLMLAVDMPLVSSGLLEFIASRCDTQSLVVVPRVRSQNRAQLNGASPADGASQSHELLLQPLCAAYHRRLLPYIDRALSKDELSIHRLLERLRAGMMKEDSRAVRLIDEQELAAAGFCAEMLLNVNTPEDLERARALARTLDV